MALCRSGWGRVQARRALSTEAIQTLEAWERSRDEIGTKRAKRLRYNNFVPAQIVGNGGPDLNVKVAAQEIAREMRKYPVNFSNIVYDLDVQMENGGQRTERVTAMEVQKEAASEALHSLSFLRFNPDRPHPVAIKFINHDDSATLKRGGYILPLRDVVRVRTTTGRLPEYIELDLTGAKAGEVLYSTSRLVLPEGVEVVAPRNRNEHTFGVVQGVRSTGPTPLGEDAES